MCAKDVKILAPAESLAKSIINTSTTGEPFKIQFGVTDLLQSFALFTWRTGFPLTMPSGFLTKVQDFYDRILERVNQANVQDLERKSLASLKVDLDDIVDGIMDEVRRSPDGVYTNYLDAKVNGLPLEDACVEVGIQFKAYGMDLSNYRRIAGIVLGIPLMPQVAQTINGVVSYQPMEAIKGIRSGVDQLPGAALGAVAHVSSGALAGVDGLRTNLLMPTLSQVGQLPGGQMLDAVAQLSDSAMGSLRSSIPIPLASSMSIFRAGSQPAS